jgi:hypothetical protein
MLIFIFIHFSLALSFRRFMAIRQHLRLLLESISIESSASSNPFNFQMEPVKIKIYMKDVQNRIPRKLRARIVIGSINMVRIAHKKKSFSTIFNFGLDIR